MANKLKSLVGQNMNDCVYFNVCSRVFNAIKKSEKNKKIFKKILDKV